MTENKIPLAKTLKVVLAAFGLGAFGVALTFSGWYLVGSLLLVKFGFVVTVAGVGIGIAAIVVGQLLYGRQATMGSIKAMKSLRERLK
jgi:hypothetical protein